MATTVLRFRLQEDGRRVSRLPSGKVVLVALDAIDRVADGDWWRVKLDDRGTFAIAHPIAKASEEEARDAPALVEVPAAEERRMFPALSPGESLPEPEDVLSEDDRIAMFVDSANVANARNMGFFVDWKRAKEYFTERGRFYGAFYYVGVESDDPAQRSFLDFLSHAGYIVRTKPVKRILDRETGEERFKANLDVEIALDMMDTVGNWDVAFLFTGDGDFARAVELLRSRGKRVYVVSPWESMARELAYVADKPVFFLDNYGKVLGRVDRKPV